MQYNELLFGLFNNLKALYQKNLKFPNISFQQVLAISMIENRGVGMSYFSKKLGIDNSTATRLVDGLEKKKLVKRERDESDNRIIKVFLTKSGEKIYTSIEVQLEKIGYLIEQQFDENSKEGITESCLSLNWEIIKLLNR